MKKIKSYNVAVGNSPYGLCREVAEQIEAGYQPYGDMQIQQGYGVAHSNKEPKFIQPMVEYEKDS